MPSDTPDTVIIAGKEYLTFPTGFAREIKKSDRTVRRMQASRIGPPVIEIGKTKIVDPDDVPGWLASLKRAPMRVGGGRRKVA